MRLIDAGVLREVIMSFQYTPTSNENERCVRAIDAAPTVEMPGWISVKDRLPERGNTCLVWLRGGGMTFMVFDGSRFVGGSAYSDDRITHWMLLPGAPKEVETDA